MKLPKVAIIIINWNGINDTIECLESLKKIKYKKFKIILIDNNSKNNEAEKIKKKFPNVTLIKNNKNEGFCKANNAGIGLSLKYNFDYILLLNNDTIVKKNFLNILITTMEKDKNIGASSPKILYPNSEKIWSMGGKNLDTLGISVMIGKGKKENKYKKIVYPDFLTGCAMLIRVDLIKKIGNLDEKYFAYYEDVDYSKRIKKEGYKIVTQPKSIIFHKKSASAGIRGSNKISKIQAYLQMRNSLYLLRKHNPRLFYLKAMLIILFKGGTLFLKSENFNCTKSIYQGIKDGLRK